MSVICPRCHARCGDNDTYCFNCGTSLSGVPRQPEPETREGRADADAAPDSASSWPSRGERQPVEEATTYVPPAASTSRATDEDGDTDFVPLQFESPASGAEGRRRWLLVAIVLLALLVLGAVAATIWARAGDSDNPEEPLSVIDPTSAPTEVQAVVATPATSLSSGPTATVAPATPVTSGSLAEREPVSAAVLSTPTTIPEPTAATATSEPPPTVVPTAVSRRAALSEVALLPSGLLRDLAGDGSAATPPAVSSPETTEDGATAPKSGDGTGGVILLPGEATEIPEIGPAQQTPTPDVP